MPWNKTPERIALELKIIELWEKGMTSSGISQEVKITRSAVMGLIHRARAAGAAVSRKKDDSPPKRPRAKRPTADVIQITPRPITLPKLESTAPAAPIILFPIKDTVMEEEPPNKVRFADLKSDSCRFIVEGRTAEKYRFCHKTKERGAYCEEHAKLCYVPLSKPSKNTIRKAFKLMGRPNRFTVK